MKAILLSIKEPYFEDICAGKKIYEYRKRKNRQDVAKILFYVTSPVAKICGEAEIETVLSGKPSDIWSQTKDYSGTTKEFFDDYFSSYTTAIAYKLRNPKKYTRPFSISDLGINQVPQSFMYIDIND